jgi:hypothetical protein
MLEQITQQLRIIALEQIAYVERWAKQRLLETGVKLTGAEKKAEAKRRSKEIYRQLTASTFLGSTTVDDTVVDAAIDAAIDFVFDKAGALVNQLGALLPDASPSAPELPEGGLQ